MGTVIRRVALLVVVSVVLATVPEVAVASEAPEFGPGAPGVGDPYFPLDGNGGYDVRHYGLDVEYDPDTDLLEGEATITAHADQNLSSFNLDLVGLEVHEVEVDGRPAEWTRDGDELTIVPERGLHRGSRFVIEVDYSGSPEPVVDAFGVSGFFHTDDGTLVIGEPHVAATWYPVNDHPIDKAKYTFEITVPAGLEAIANGELVDEETDDGKTTWVWDAKEPMASYLTTATIGEFDLREYKVEGIRYWDAIDPDVLTKPEPRTGDQFALTQADLLSYKRLTRVIDVPAEGAQLSFWMVRDTEPSWDFAFVEARPAGTDDWTTLPDQNGHTSQDTGFVCPFWLDLHPFLTHYQTDAGDGTCAPSGTTGDWWAASGSSDGYEQWVIDLSGYAGDSVEVSISHASDDIFQLPGLFVDDVVVSTGEGSTSFEDDGNPFDGWTVPGAPAGSPPNDNDWIVGTAADVPPGIPENLEASLGRQPEIIEWLSGIAGPYPFSSAGAIVDDHPVGFALENQTRPIYDPLFFVDPIGGDLVVVHELAHQWYGDSVALAAWPHIWLNEGFASYAEWMWLEREGLVSAQDNFDAFAAIPADDPFWALAIGDPGPDHLFDFPVYARGAMTLHALRTTVGDRDFFRILRRWAQSNRGDNVSTDDLIALAEKVSGEQLDDLFDEWLFTPEKPAGISEATGDGPDVAALQTPSGGSSLVLPHHMHLGERMGALER